MMIPKENIANYMKDLNSAMNILQLDSELH